MNQFFSSLILSVLFSTSVFAYEAKPEIHWSTTEIKKILGEYPARYSEEEKKDFEELFHWQNTRTENDCAAAAAEENANFYAFFGKEHNLLTEAEIKTAAPVMHKASVTMLEALSKAKNYYKRQRPFLYNAEIEPCIEKASGYAYPSGQATSARLYARLLGKMFPDRAEAFLKRADEAALFRVLGGVHHPTDIDAGKKLGDAIAIKIKLKF